MLTPLALARLLVKHCCAYTFRRPLRISFVCLAQGLFGRIGFNVHSLNNVRVRGKVVTATNAGRRLDPSPDDYGRCARVPIQTNLELADSKF